MTEQYRTQIRMPSAIADWLKRQAEEEGRSLNAQMVQMFKEAMQREQKQA
ncbi:Arc-like DNA binding dprotein [Modicisalibacter xianhensis]|uniref:Arc-like DNA binding dprotein n=1 Tax=Modicisalibacter xianhensis TaxID=442341 RepID=A0A4R8G655_9GAMM|nr:Arc family DNA-binding protein [Halomonas xianhensis]TDX30749.1 Arc-like DNA binding dprotein [Halomonas xianhensis]